MGKGQTQFEKNLKEPIIVFDAIIRKKGHINERAFSYSIRNEQRSRSYGSLVDIEIGPNGEPIQNNNTEGQNGGPGEMEGGPRSKKRTRAHANDDRFRTWR